MIRALSARVRRGSAAAGVGVGVGDDDPPFDSGALLEQSAAIVSDSARSSTRLIMTFVRLRMTSAGGISLAPRWARHVRPGEHITVMSGWFPVGSATDALIWMVA